MDDEAIEFEELDLEPLPDEPPPREPLAVRPWIANAVALALIAAVVVMLDAHDRRTPSMVFPDRTGQVLVLEDNTNSFFADREIAGPMVLLDLDHRIAVRRLLVGNAPGVEPVSMLPFGRSIAYGFGSTYAAPFDGGRRRSIGTRSILIPGASRGHVLQLQYASTAHEGVPTVRELGHGLRGRGMPEDPSGPSPARGFSGGIAYNSQHGVVLWDVVHRREIGRLGSGRAWVTSGRRDLLSWCNQDCATLHITKIRGPDHELHAPNGLRFARGFPAITRFSSDGRYAAVAAGRILGGAWAGTDIVLIDTRTWKQRVVHHDPSKLPEGCVLKEISQPGCAPPYVAGPAWSPDGARLFFLIFDQASAKVSVGEYNVAAKRVVGIAPVPIQGAYAPTSYDAAELAGMLRVPLSRLCLSSSITAQRRTCATRF